eukprot:4378425-Pleurochrysis_carterae.AAC.1
MESIRRSIAPNATDEQLRTCPVLPVKETQVRHTFKLKLQRQTAIKGFCHFETFRPTQGLGATRILTRK